jgi:hypothetical protein
VVRRVELGDGPVLSVSPYTWMKSQPKVFIERTRSALVMGEAPYTLERSDL